VGIKSAVDRLRSLGITEPEIRRLLESELSVTQPSRRFATTATLLDDGTASRWTHIVTIGAKVLRGGAPQPNPTSCHARPDGSIHATSAPDAQSRIPMRHGDRSFSNASVSRAYVGLNETRALRLNPQSGSRPHFTRGRRPIGALG
jgi:hypothetical protein